MGIISTNGKFWIMRENEREWKMQLKDKLHLFEPTCSHLDQATQFTDAFDENQSGKSRR